MTAVRDASSAFLGLTDQQVVDRRPALELLDAHARRAALRANETYSIRGAGPKSGKTASGPWTSGARIDSAPR